MESLKMSVELNVEPNKVYDAWMSSKEHSEMTDSPAKIENKVGTKQKNCAKMAHDRIS